MGKAVKAGTRWGQALAAMLTGPRAVQLPPIRRKLMFEALEERLLLSGNPLATVSAAGLLQAQFTTDADQVLVQQVGTAVDGGAIIDLSTTGLTERYGSAATGIQGVDLKGLSGNDSFKLVGLTVDAGIDGGEGSDTLNGQDADSTWDLAGTNAGTLTSTGKVTFTQIENLVGGSHADDFVFADQAGIEGTVDGGLGGNSLDYAAYLSAITVNLGLLTASGTGGVLHFATLTGGAAFDTLVDTAADTLWRVTGSDAGEIRDVVSFTGIENLTGAAQNQDGFVIEAEGSIRGLLSGGTGCADNLIVAKGADLDYAIVNVANTAAATVVIYGKTLQLAGLEPILATAAGVTTISGSSYTDKFLLESVDAGNMRIRSSGADFFDVVTGTVVSVLAFANPASALNLSLGGGKDTLTLGTIDAGFAASLTYNGGADDDALAGRDLANNWNISATNAGTLARFAGSDYHRGCRAGPGSRTRRGAHAGVRHAAGGVGGASAQGCALVREHPGFDRHDCIWLPAPGADGTCDDLLAQIEHLARQVGDDLGEHPDQHHRQHHQEEERQGRPRDIEHVLAGQPLQHEQVEAHRRGHLRHLDHQHDIDAEPQEIDAGGLDRGQDHRGGQHDHRDAVKEHAQDDEQHREHGDQLPRLKALRADPGGHGARNAGEAHRHGEKRGTGQDEGDHARGAHGAHHAAGEGLFGQ